MKKAYLLTGEPRVGKTTALKKIIDAIGLERCGGFYTEEIRVQGARVGFQLVTLDGQRNVFAHVASQSPIRLGRYGINLVCLETIGIAAVEQAMEAKQLVIIDEIGPMELYSDRFKKTVVEVLRSTHPLLSTIALKPHPWLDAVKKYPDVALYRLTLANRDALVEILINALKG